MRGGLHRLLHRQVLRFLLGRLFSLAGVHLVNLRADREGLLTILFFGDRLCFSFSLDLGFCLDHSVFFYRFFGLEVAGWCLGRVVDGQGETAARMSSPLVFTVGRIIAGTLAMLGEDLMASSSPRMRVSMSLTWRATSVEISSSIWSFAGSPAPGRSHLDLLAVALDLFNIDDGPELAAGGVRDRPFGLEEKCLFVCAPAHQRVDDHVTLADPRLAPAFHRPGRLQLVTGIDVRQHVGRLELRQADIEREGNERIELIL